MQRVDVGGVALEVSIAGDGAPLLFLHGGDYFAQNRAFLDRLARRWRVFAPRHPGFGATERPDGFRTVHDLAYLYLDMIEQQGLDDAVVVGSSFGGWIALEMCVRSIERVGRLVLIDTLGVKFGAREERDIADIYALPADEALRRTFFEPQRWAPDYSQLGDEEATAIARQWLHRVRLPALVLWGENDGIVRPDYGERLCRALPDARFAAIPQAGHYPQIERPEEVADAIEGFARAEVKR
jgi:pimeloyl-ACP methyl ester carboxylesterase